MITTYLVQYRLEDSVCWPDEWDELIVRATTKYSAKEKFFDYLESWGVWHRKFKITEHVTEPQH